MIENFNCSYVIDRLSWVAGNRVRQCEQLCQLFLAERYDGIFDCSDLAAYAINVTSLYSILSDETHALSVKQVRCDMDVDTGG